jgi:hypothetical protein
LFRLNERKDINTLHFFIPKTVTSCDGGIIEDVKKTKNTSTLKACLSSPVVQG